MNTGSLKGTKKLLKIKTMLTKDELALFKKLKNPIDIQDYLDTVPFNFQKKIETYYSPREVIKNNTAHCLEGALLAALALWLNGEPPLILDLKAPKEVDHVVAIYKRNGYFGAISKTNHACLRFRDPAYKTIRELVMSYYHEYFDNKTGEKLLMSYSNPIDLSKYKTSWTVSDEKLDWIVDIIESRKHFQTISLKNKKYIRKADKVERKAGEVVEWKD